jgi:hypothetical protein
MKFFAFLLVLATVNGDAAGIFRTLRNILFGSSDNNRLLIASNDDCAINIRNELNRTATGTVKEPLFLKYHNGGYNLIIPDENGDLKFKGGESALIACTSDQKPNTLTLSKYKERHVHVTSPS